MLVNSKTVLKTVAMLFHKSASQMSRKNQLHQRFSRTTKPRNIEHLFDYLHKHPIMVYQGLIYFRKVMEAKGKLDEYFTVGEAANFLGVSSSTLRNWDRAGKLVPYRHPINGYRLYRKSDLETLLKNVRQQNDESKRT